MKDLGDKNQTSDFHYPKRHFAILVLLGSCMLEPILIMENDFYSLIKKFLVETLSI